MVLSLATRLRTGFLACLQRPRTRTSGGWIIGAFQGTRIFVAALISLLAGSSAALADWHYGRVDQLGIGYDGNTIAFRLTGWIRNDCTCYSVWPNQMCLDRNRPTSKEEYAWLLRARVTGQQIGVNIDETTCTVVALHESD